MGRREVSTALAVGINDSFEEHHMFSMAIILMPLASPLLQRKSALVMQ